ERWRIEAHLHHGSDPRGIRPRDAAQITLSSSVVPHRVVSALPARQCPGELTYCLLMLLVPDLAEVAGDLELHTVVERDLPHTLFPDTFVKIGDRRAQHARDLK